MDFSRLVNKHILDLVPYQSARRIGGHGHTFLNANESPKCDTFLMNSLKLNRYPDCQPGELLESYGGYCGLRQDHILISRGSDEAIGLIIRAFCSWDEGIVIAQPTYGMYAVAAATNHVQVACARREADFSLKAAAVIEAAQVAPFTVKAVFIDSPGNPLGVVFPQEELKALLEGLPDTLVVVDEAYIEFAPEKDVTRLVTEYPSLIVTRTLSKAFALAGIRCGFTLANPEVIKLLLKVIDPYPVPDPVAQIALQALTPMGLKLMQARVADCLKRRGILESALRTLKCVDKIFDSQANFLLIRFRDGPKVFSRLAERGIIVRSFEDKPGLENCLRITIGSAEELEEVMRLLQLLDGED